VDFVYDLTVPANTSAASLKELEIDVGTGIVHLVEIEIPRGCKGMVYGAIRQGLHQVWPTNPDGAYHSDGRVYSARDHYGIIPGDPSLVLQGWSPGTTYDHTVQFRISVLPEEVMEPWHAQEGLLTRLLRALGVR
jgi:hypothetical protein